MENERYLGSEGVLNATTSSVCGCGHFVGNTSGFESFNPSMSYSATLQC